jgi:hypothetical protein
MKTDTIKSPAEEMLLRRSGATCQSSAVRCSTEIFSRMYPTGCTKKSPPIYNDMIYGASKPEIEAKRKAFIRK